MKKPFRISKIRYQNKYSKNHYKIIADKIRYFANFEYKCVAVCVAQG